MSDRASRPHTSLRQIFATSVEPHIIWPQYFDWRIRHSIKKIHDFEVELAERDDRWLTQNEASRFSQNGEDGIISEICKRIELTNLTFVEVGAGDGSENCTRALAEDGWSGVWVEGDANRAQIAQETVQDRDVEVVNSFITKENAVDLIQRAGAPPDLGLLVVDIDGNDWWVLEKLLGHFSPEVVVLEYNSAMGLSKWVLPYDPVHEWQHDRRHGASLKSFSLLLDSFDLTLVGTDSLGVNAFFVAERHAGLFGYAGNVEKHYTPPRHLLPFGHPWKQDGHTMLTLTDTDDLCIDITDVEVIEGGLPDSVDLLVHVHNDSNAVLRSSGDHPLHIGIWWGDADSRMTNEPERWKLLWPVPTGGTRPTFVRITRPSEVSTLNIGLVQEGIRWLTSHKSISTV